MKYRGTRIPPLSLPYSLPQPHVRNSSFVSDGRKGNGTGGRGGGGGGRGGEERVYSRGRLYRVAPRGYLRRYSRRKYTSPRNVFSRGMMRFVTFSFVECRSEFRIKTGQIRRAETFLLGRGGNPPPRRIPLVSAGSVNFSACVQTFLAEFDRGINSRESARGVPA